MMDDPETNRFGDLLKWFRKRVHLTQKGLADAIGDGSHGSVQSWERYLYLPREKETVLALARALRLTESETDRLLLAAHHPQEYNTQGSGIEKGAQVIQPTLKTDTSDPLLHIENRLTDLTDLLATRFSKLISAFGDAPTPLREQIRDYAPLIQRKTHDFVGREFVFDEVTHFAKANPNGGYYFIQGDPGIGKSALAAQMVRTHGYVHHFNIRNRGINTADIFLRNVCAQLIVAYQLNHTFLPPYATQDAEFLSRLLKEVSDKIGPQEKAFIVVDALDEVDMSGLSSGVNALYLPDTLPHGIYIIVTTRNGPINLRMDCAWDTLPIIHDSAGNVADIREYVERAVERPGIQTYIAVQGIDNELFIDHLAEKSEYNFMYLHYVLPQIEYGYYKDLGLEALPRGLQNYYDDHWYRMRNQDEEVWFNYKLPIVMALTAVKEPVSIDLIADFSYVHERARIREVLHEWAQFLHEEKVLCEGALQKRYHVYHSSFHDFIARKEEVEDERVSRKEADKKIADIIWVGLFGNS